MKLESINPATGELIERFEEISDQDLEGALQQASRPFAHTVGHPLSSVPAGCAMPHRSWTPRATNGRA